MKRLSKVYFSVDITQKCGWLFRPQREARDEACNLHEGREIDWEILSYKRKCNLETAQSMCLICVSSRLLKYVTPSEKQILHSNTKPRYVP